MINYMDYRHLILVPTLRYLEPEIPYSSSAETLVGGTAAHESGLRRLRQAGGGPARGIYQCEPATHQDIYDHFLIYHPALKAKVQGLLAPHPEPVDQLVSNWLYATAICRVHYRRVKAPLPRDPLDFKEMAAYWKKNYNSRLGKGTEDQFINAFMKHVMADPRSLEFPT